MSNPFDQFASELNAAMPGAPPPQQPQQQQQQQQAPAPPAGDMYGAPPPSAYGAPPPAYGAPPPQQQQQQAPPSFAYGAPPSPAYGQPPPPAAPPAAAPAADPFGGFGMAAAPPAPPVEPVAPPTAPAPPAAPPSGMDNPFGAQPTQPAAAASFDSSAPRGPPTAPVGGPADPWGAPQQQQPPPQQQMNYGQPPPPGPYGAPPPQGQGPPPAQYGGALVPAEVQNNPYAAYGQQPPPPGPYGAPPQQDPYGGGGPPPQQAQQDPYGAPVDPFSVFNAAPAPGPPPPGPESQALVVAGGAPPPGAQPTADEDFWGAFSATAPADATAAADAVGGGAMVSVSGGDSRHHEEKKSGSEELPPGGEWYDARIFTPTLGVMFFKPQELTDSLFLNTDKNIVDSLNERPVVAFIVEGSSARSAGVELGHVLLKVNGVDVKNPKEASRLIKEGPRPLPLLFYVPNAEVVVAEGEHMVKYDTRETTAPNSAKDWKPKYVVIGGIIAQPWMMNMYRSKSEYDIAVIETQARRPVSVKVKQFSLQGARIQNDWQGPQMVKYKNKLHPWKYIVVLPVARNPIKISSPNLASLKPCHEGIRRVLLAQQRDRGNTSSSRQQQQPQQQQQQQQAPPQQSYSAQPQQQAAGAGGQQPYRY